MGSRTSKTEAGGDGVPGTVEGRGGASRGWRGGQDCIPAGLRGRGGDVHLHPQGGQVPGSHGSVRTAGGSPWEAAVVFQARGGVDLGSGGGTGLGEKRTDLGLDLEADDGAVWGKERSCWWPLGSLPRKLVLTSG